METSETIWECNQRAGERNWGKKVAWGFSRNFCLEGNHSEADQKDWNSVQYSSRRHQLSFSPEMINVAEFQHMTTMNNFPNTLGVYHQVKLLQYLILIKITSSVFSKKTFTHSMFLIPSCSWNLGFPQSPRTAGKYEKQMRRRCKLFTGCTTRKHDNKTWRIKTKTVSQNIIIILLLLL